MSSIGIEIGVSVEKCSGKSEDGISVDKEEQKAEIIALIENYSLVMGKWEKPAKKNHSSDLENKGIQCHGNQETTKKMRAGDQWCQSHKKVRRMKTDWA